MSGPEHSGWADKLEKNTRRQAGSRLWFRARRRRLTASRFGRLCKMGPRANVLAMCQSLYAPSDLSRVPAVAHGMRYERAALKRFCARGHAQAVLPAGLFVLPELPFLGATPDGILDERRIVEVKCPYSARYRKINPGLVPFLRGGGGRSRSALSLAPGHDYYYQVQGQLQLARREICLLVVYTIADLAVVEVPRDRPFWERVELPRLVSFYQNHYLPFLQEKGDAGDEGDEEEEEEDDEGGGGGEEEEEEEGQRLSIVPKPFEVFNAGL